MREGWGNRSLGKGGGNVFLLFIILIPPPLNSLSDFIFLGFLVFHNFYRVHLFYENKILQCLLPPSLHNKQEASHVKRIFTLFFPLHVLSCSWMLLNSSMQHSPPSASTKAPASSCHSPESLTAATVSPALVEPIPVVRTERGMIFAAYFKNWDFPVPNANFKIKTLNK